jgi:hypothetical protein
MAFLLKCPDCRGKFRWDPTKGMPKNCALCGAYVGHDRDDEDIVVPFIRHASTTASDKVYRDMERGSDRRAEMAAETLGVPVSEMSGIRITDLNPTRHEGDVAAVPVNNEVSRAVEAPQSPFGFQRDSGLGFSGPVASGPFPNSGARTQTMLRGAHAERMGWDKVGDRPANEVMQPGYRRRV